ncbi:MAG: ABC transporter permease [Chloroflexi bacterium]|nr:ABC transporter permease [Chloroflexota bacterium]
MSPAKVMAIARVNVVRLLRDRAGLFFIFVFPLMLVLVLGLSFGGGFATRIGVVADEAGELGDELVDGLAAEPVGWEIRRYEDADDLREDVRSGVVGAGLVLPVGYDRRLRAASRRASSLSRRHRTSRSDCAARSKLRSPTRLPWFAPRDSLAHRPTCPWPMRSRWRPRPRDRCRSSKSR